MRTILLAVLAGALVGCGVTAPESLESLCVENCDRAWKRGCRANHDCSHCARDAVTALKTGCVDESFAFQACVSVHVCNSQPCSDEAEVAVACESKRQ